MDSISDSADGGSKSTFLDAMPDLVIGLVGIPVAISAQNIADTAFQSGSLSSLAAGIGYFFLVIIIYGLTSIGLLMVVETDHFIIKTEKEWQQKLIRRLVFVTGPMLLFTISVIALGITYEAPIPIKSGFVQVLLQPRSLVAVSVACSCAVAGSVFKPVSSVSKRFPVIHPYFASILFGLLVVAFGLVLKP